MKQLFFILCMMMGTSAFAQSTYEVSKDDMNGEKVYKGVCTPQDLDKESSFSWYRKGVKSYKPDKMDMLMLHQYLKQYTILVFMGTWCDDSHNLVPKLVKVMKEADYPMNQLTIYGVTRDKTARGATAAQYHLESVPTIIVLKGNKEIGRITETVKKSIESDLNEIVQKDIAFSR